MSEMDVLFPLPDGRRNADDMGMPCDPGAERIDALVARVRELEAERDEARALLREAMEAIGELVPSLRAQIDAALAGEKP